MHLIRVTELIAVYAFYFLVVAQKRAKVKELLEEDFNLLNPDKNVVSFEQTYDRVLGLTHIELNII